MVEATEESAVIASSERQLQRVDVFLTHSKNTPVMGVDIGLDDLINAVKRTPRPRAR
jgi:hypothetical protein